MLSSCLLALALYLAYDVFMGVHSISVWMLCDVAVQSLFVGAIGTLCNRKREPLLLQGVALALVLLANGLKVHFRMTPLIPLDIFLVKDAMLIADPVQAVAVFVAVGLCVVAVAYRMVSNGRRPAWRDAVWGVLPLIYCTWLLVFPATYYATYDWLMTYSPVRASFLLREKSEQVGWALTFSIELSRYIEAHSFQPTQSEVERASHTLSQWAPLPLGPAVAPEHKPNVYIILSESFWDPSTLVQGANAAFLDEGFKQLWRQAGAHSFISPVYGGGTANAEFEVLCGIPSRAVAKGTIFQTELSNSMPCLPELLRRQGYSTLAFHPYLSGYYNRKQAFKLLGFDRFFTQEDFEPDPVEGKFITDQSFIDQTLRIVQKADATRPKLVYMMTFAGHWPFIWHAKSYNTAIHVRTNDPNAGELQRHLNINRIASTALSDAMRAIRKSDPGAIIITAGDHQPSLTTGIATVPPPQESLTEARFFSTPIVALGPGETALLNRDIAAYEIPQVVLQAARIPLADRAYMPLFAQPALTFRRPLGSGVQLQLGESELTCLRTEAEMSPGCERIREWFRAAKVVGADLVHGHQHVLRNVGSFDRGSVVGQLTPR